MRTPCYPEGMGVLHVTTKGARLVRRNGTLAVEKGGLLLRTLPINKVRYVFLHPGTHVTEPARRLVLGNGGRLVHVGRGGAPEGLTFGQVWPPAERVLAQARLLEDQGRRLVLGRALVRGKLRSQAAYLDLRARWALAKDEDPEPFARAAAAIRATEGRLESARTLEQVRGYEGVASRMYFEALEAHLRKKGVPFRGRETRPPADYANAALSYGYGIVRSLVTLGVLGSGLVVGIGVVHEPHHNQPALALDLLDLFRVVAVDMVVVRLLTNKIISKKHAVPVEGGVYLNEKGREQTIKAIQRRLETAFHHPVLGRKRPLLELIEIEAARLAGAIVSGRDYKAFYLDRGEG